MNNKKKKIKKGWIKKGGIKKKKDVGGRVHYVGSTTLHVSRKEGGSGHWR